MNLCWLSIWLYWLLNLILRRMMPLSTAVVSQNVCVGLEILFVTFSQYSLLVFALERVLGANKVELDVEFKSLSNRVTFDLVVQQKRELSRRQCVESAKGSR